MAPLLSLEHVEIRFGGLKAVDDVSLAVAAGERRAVIGPNGAGKTTLFNAITGMVRPSAGRIVFAGRDITRQPPHARAGLGMSRTFQITNLFPTLTVDQNMQLAMAGTGRRKFSLLGPAGLTEAEDERAAAALALSRLGHRRGHPVSDLSYGEQRQLEMAMVFATRPRLLLLDEPAAGLSPAERIIVSDIIRALPRDLTIVVIEHDMDLVLKLVDRVTCLNNGRFLAEGLPAEIRDDRAVQDVYLGRPRTETRRRA